MLPGAHRKIIVDVLNDLKIYEKSPKNIDLAVAASILPDEWADFYRHRPNIEGTRRIFDTFSKARTRLVVGEVAGAYMGAAIVSHYIVDSSTWSHFADIYKKFDTYVPGDTHADYEREIEKVIHSNGDWITKIRQLDIKTAGNPADIDYITNILVQRRNKAKELSFSKLWNSCINGDPGKGDAIDDIMYAYSLTYIAVKSILSEPELPRERWDDAEKLYKKSMIGWKWWHYFIPIAVLLFLNFIFFNVFWVFNIWIDTMVLNLYIFKIRPTRRLSIKLKNNLPIFIKMRYNNISGFTDEPNNVWYKLPDELRKRMLS